MVDCTLRSEVHTYCTNKRIKTLFGWYERFSLDRLCSSLASQLWRQSVAWRANYRKSSRTSNINTRTLSQSRATTPREYPHTRSTTPNSAQTPVDLCITHVVMTHRKWSQAIVQHTPLIRIGAIYLYSMKTNL